jgi:N-acetylglucosaminyldiphosphoundecaprenol N-acetyl-beta-D-mannosaminyltransferase
VDSIEILGVRVDDVTYEDLLAQVDAFVANGQPHQIVTINAEMLVAAYDDPALSQILNAADLVVPDSAGVMLAARLLGYPLQERVTGSDGIYRLAAHCALRAYRPFFLGAAPGVAALVATRLIAANPGLVVAGYYSGSPRIEDEAEVLAEVHSASPDLLLVAYGVPAEERWIARNRMYLRVPVMMGVGGTFDFVAGVTRRAPVWMRRLGLEWLHRLVQEPWRWRRQLSLPRFAALVVKQRVTMGRRKRSTSEKTEN